MAIHRLKGAIQHYAWGGKYFLPNLLDIDNTDKEPYAELWMGTHIKGPAKILNNKKPNDLTKYIKKNAKRILGKEVIAKFGEQLPFLFKVLDVNKMLSIQAHPSKKAAEVGFAKEEESGIDRVAPNRTYRDNNHKPEIMIAITNFWLLHGFKSIEGINEVLAISEFRVLVPSFKDNNIFSLYRAVMEMPQEAVDFVLDPLWKRLKPAHDAGTLEKDQADYWAATAFEEYTIDGHYDRGIFSIYLFNLVRLKKGEGIFQDAGIPHAYLEGVNVELMANSDNVFRGGLTQKYVNVPELMAHLTFESITPKILVGSPISVLEKVFKTAAPDFELSQIKLDKGQIYRIEKHASVQVLIVIEGEGAILGGTKELTIKKGEIFLIEANTPYKILPKQEALIFKAKVPV